MSHKQKSYFGKNPTDMTLEERNAYIEESEDYYEELHAFLGIEKWNEYCSDCTQFAIEEIMKSWQCTEHEARTAILLDCDTLEDTQFCIAQAVTYERLVNILPITCAKFLREEYYKDDPHPEDRILHEAERMAESEAWKTVYEENLVDDYSEMTEEEKEAVI